MVARLPKALAGWREIDSSWSNSFIIWLSTRWRLPLRRAECASMFSPVEPLRVVVHNQGVIPAALRDKIFNKLSSYQPSRGGGLGAYIAKLIAEQHGGSVRFTTAEQEGTTFTVELPIAAASQ